MLRLVKVGSKNYFNAFGLAFVQSALRLLRHGLWPPIPEFLGSMVYSSSLDGIKTFQCPNCSRAYKLKSSLRNHEKWECGKEPQFQCPYCPYRAKQKMHVARHIERMHKEEIGLRPESPEVTDID